MTQAAARNGLCWGVAELERLGFPHVIHVHDEVLVLCQRERDAVLRARDGLLSVFGPTGNSPWGWATLIRPDEISVTELMFEDEDDLKKPFFDEKEKVWKGGRWQRIEAGPPDCRDGLP